MTLADTIRDLTREHLAKGGLLLGQNLDAIQNVCNTVPMDAPKGIEVMPTTETAGAGIAVGAALTGRRIIHVIRFQSFLWLQASPFINYAAKAREIWGYPCPLWIRAIAFDDPGSGPVHTNCFHSPFMHTSGLTVVAPMTSLDYLRAWEDFMNQDGPFLVSEHRRSFDAKEPLYDEGGGEGGIALFPISASRFNTAKAADILRGDGINTSILHIDYLKPFKMKVSALAELRNSKLGLVIDAAPTICGAPEHIAYELMLETGLPCKALGMEDRCSGIAPGLLNGTPSAEKIAEVAKEFLRTLT